MNNNVIEKMQQTKMLIGNKKYKEALAYLEEIEKNDPMEIQIYTLRGLCYANLEQYEKAIESYKKALKINRNDGHIYFDIGNLLLLTGKTKEAELSFLEAREKGYNLSQLDYHLGLLKENQGNMEQAIRLYTKAVNADPLRGDIRLHKINLLMGQDKLNEAMEEINKLIKYNPDAFEGYHYAAMLMVSSGECDRAEKLVKMALDIFPEDINLGIDQVSVWLKQEKYDQAETKLDELKKMAIDPIAKRNVLRKCVHLASAQEDMEKVIDLLEEIVALCNAERTINSESVFILINCYLSTGNSEKATQCVEMLKQAEKNDGYGQAAYYYEALILKQEKGIDVAKDAFWNAISVYRQLSMESPLSITAYIYRILCLKELKEYDEALNLVKYLEDTNEKIPEVHALHATLYEAMGDEEAAQAEWEKIQATESDGMMSIIKGLGNNGKSTKN